MKELKDGIYIAPKMRCVLTDFNKYIVKDEKNNRDLDPEDIENKILIYEREQTEWFLETAKKLLEEESFIYAPIVIMVCVSYLEGVEQYKSGHSSKNQSAEFFKKSIKKIWPSIARSKSDQKLGDQKLDNFYRLVRCGLFHEASLKGGVTFDEKYSESIEISVEGIKINQRKFLQDITEDFRIYIAELKNPGSVNLRKNFELIFNIAPQQRKSTV